jgi:peptidyl-prolyl cis-trans isomerase D
LNISLEVVRWANEAKVGDMSEIIKIGESYVVAIVTAVEESEYEPIEKATTKIKPVLMAQKKAAILKEKMQGATLEEIAANAGATVKEFSGVKTSSSFISGIGMEPSVIGTLEGVTAEGAGKLLPLVEGKNGVYALVVDEVAVEATQTVEAERVKAQAELESMAGGRAMWAAKEAANIEDNTVKFF